MNWPLDRLEHWAAHEQRFWPSVYLAPNLLEEALWFALNCGGRDD